MTDRLSNSPHHKSAVTAHHSPSTASHSPHFTLHFSLYTLHSPIFSLQPSHSLSIKSNQRKRSNMQRREDKPRHARLIMEMSSNALEAAGLGCAVLLCCGGIAFVWRPHKVEWKSEQTLSGTCMVIYKEIFLLLLSCKKLTERERERGRVRQTTLKAASDAFQVTKVQLVGGKARQKSPGPPCTMIYGFVACHLALEIIVEACTWCA